MLGRTLRVAVLAAATVGLAAVGGVSGSDLTPAADFEAVILRYGA